MKLLKMQVQPVKAYPVQQPVQNVVAVDMNSFMVLNAVQRVSVKQLGALGEAVTCGRMAIHCHIQCFL